MSTVKRITTPIITSRVTIRVEAMQLINNARVLMQTYEEFYASYQTLLDHIAAPALVDYAEGYRDASGLRISLTMCEEVYTLPDGSKTDVLGWAASGKPACSYSLVWKGTDSVFEGPTGIRPHR